MADVPEPRRRAIEDDPERSTLLRGSRKKYASLTRVAPRQRLVLALRELEDSSYAEIGVIVGLKRTQSRS